MTPAQIDLVRQTFTAVTDAPEAFTADFYAELFRLDPTLRPLFPVDMDEQGRKLAAMLGAVVKGLGDPALTAQYRVLGQRHARYGVREEHYDLVGTALLKTLHVALGPRYDDAVEAAWATLYGEIAETMIAAGGAVREPAEA